MTDTPNDAPETPETPASFSEADALQAADAWHETGFSVWESVKEQIAAESAEPTPVRADALARPLYAEGRLPTIDLTRHAPEPAALAALPAELAQMHRALPVRKDNDKLWVAWEDVPHLSAIDAVRFAARCHVVPLIALSPAAFAAAFEAAYPPPAAEAARPAAGANEMLYQTVRDLQADVALLRHEIRALKEAAAKSPPSAQPTPPYLPSRRASAPPFPITPPADFWPFPILD